jgi:hypothetical protein
VEVILGQILAKGTHGGGGKIKIKLYTYNLF